MAIKRSLGGEDPLQEGTATHSSVLARKIPWTEEPGGLQSIRSSRVRHNGSNLAHREMVREHTDLAHREMVSFQGLREGRDE